MATVWATPVVMTAPAVNTFLGPRTPVTVVVAGPGVEVLPGPAMPMSQVGAVGPLFPGPPTPIAIVVRPVLPGKSIPIT